MTELEAKTLQPGDRLQFKGENRNATVLSNQEWEVWVHYDMYGMGRWPIDHNSERMKNAERIAFNTSFFTNPRAPYRQKSS